MKKCSFPISAGGIGWLKLRFAFQASENATTHSVDFVNVIAPLMRAMGKPEPPHVESIHTAKCIHAVYPGLALAAVKEQQCSAGTSRI
jgi:hypothetical protein